MHFRASNPYDYYRPSKCERRVALRHRGVKESPRTEFDELLARLGASHETAHLDSLSNVKNLDGLDPESQERETLAAIRAGVPARGPPRAARDQLLRFGRDFSASSAPR
jgi:hypothetical protein